MLKKSLLVLIATGLILIATPFVGAQDSPSTISNPRPRTTTVVGAAARPIPPSAPKN